MLPYNQNRLIEGQTTLVRFGRSFTLIFLTDSLLLIDFSTN